MSNELWTASCVTMLLGLAMAVAGGILKYLNGGKRPYPGIAEARVVDIVAVKRDRSVLSEFRNRQAAVFEFYADGKLVKVTDTEDVYPCPYHLHQRVRLCYNPANPKQYRIIRRENGKRAAAALNVCGIGLMLAGCCLFLMYASRFEL